MKPLLDQTSDEFHSIFEFAPTGILSLGLDGKFLKANKSLCKMFGYSEKELQQINFRNITHADDLAESNLMIDNLIRQKIPFIDFEKRYIHKSGRIVWANVRAVLMKNKEEKPMHIITHIRDISDQKAAEDQLKEISIRDNAILAAVPDIIMQVDDNKIYNWANQAGYDFFGEDVIGKEASFYFEGEQETYQMVAPLFEDTEKMVYIESWQRRKDGAIRLLAWWCHVLKNSNGKVIGTLSTARDVTEERKAQQKIKESAALYHDLVDTAQDLIWQCDIEGKYTYLNPAWEDVFGYKLHEMLGKKFSDFQNKEWAERDKNILKNLLKGEAIKGLETIHLDKEGREINLIFNAKFVKDENGKIIGTRGTAFDFTKFKTTEKALAENEAKYRMLFESMNEGVVLHQLIYNDKDEAIDYKILDLNPAFEKHTRLKQKNAKNKLASLFYESNPPPYLDIYAKVSETGTPYRFETYFPPMDKYFDISVFSPKKGLFGTIFMDITEQKNNHLKIQESEKRFRSIVENTDAGYFFIDKNGILTDVNNAWVKLYKYDSKEEIIGKYFTTVQKLDDIEAAKNFFYGILNGDEKLMTGEFSRKCKDGSIGYHSFSSRPVIQDNEVIGIEGFIVDITSLKNTETELKKYKNKLEDLVNIRTEELEKTKSELEKTVVQLTSSNQEMESFIYSVSHDLRAPLRSIMGFSEIIARRYKDDLNEEGLEYFGYIVAASKNMGNLIEDLLHFSRLAKNPVTKEIINLNEIFDYAITNLNQDIINNQAKVIIPKNLPDVSGDSLLLGQVFSNLIQNAIIYHREGIKPEVHISVEEHEKITLIKFKDNGQGIPAEHHQKIFNIFQRLHSQENYQGTGIGLSIVKKAVEAMGGSIKLESEVGTGSTFTVKLPKE